MPIALQVHHDVVAGELGACCHLGDTVGSALMIGASHGHLDLAINEGGNDLLGVRGYHDAIDPVNLAGAIDDAGHQWGPGQQLEGFSRESRRADAGGNDKQNRHDESYREGCPVSKVMPWVWRGV